MKVEIESMDDESNPDHIEADARAIRRAAPRLLIVGIVALVLAELAAANGLWIIANFVGVVAVLTLTVGGTNMLLRKDK